MTVVLDLRRDLPKVRKQWNKVSTAQLQRVCEYTAPCVVGAMVNPRKRKDLEYADTREGNSSIGVLVREGFVKVPPEQLRYLIRLQEAFDGGKPADLEEALRKAEQKYLPASGDAQ